MSGKLSKKMRNMRHNLRKDKIENLHTNVTIEKPRVQPKLAAELVFVGKYYLNQFLK
jgi:hypothetical protein